jgi:hypothetical protein
MAYVNGSHHVTLSIGTAQEVVDFHVDAPVSQQRQRRPELGGLDVMGSQRPRPEVK